MSQVTAGGRSMADDSWLSLQERGGTAPGQQHPTAEPPSKVWLADSSSTSAATKTHQLQLQPPNSSSGSHDSTSSSSSAAAAAAAAATAAAASGHTHSTEHSTWLHSQPAEGSQISSSSGSSGCGADGSSQRWARSRRSAPVSWSIVYSSYPSAVPAVPPAVHTAAGLAIAQAADGAVRWPARQTSSRQGAGSPTRCRCRVGPPKARHHRGPRTLEQAAVAEAVAVALPNHPRQHKGGTAHNRDAVCIVVAEVEVAAAGRQAAGRGATAGADTIREGGGGVLQGSGMVFGSPGACMHR